MVIQKMRGSLADSLRAAPAIVFHNKLKSNITPINSKEMRSNRRKRQNHLPASRKNDSRVNLSSRRNSPITPPAKKVLTSR